MPCGRVVLARGGRAYDVCSSPPPHEDSSLVLALYIPCPNSFYVLAKPVAPTYPLSGRPRQSLRGTFCVINSSKPTSEYLRHRRLRMALGSDPQMDLMGLSHPGMLAKAQSEQERDLHIVLVCKKAFGRRSRPYGYPVLRRATVGSSGRDGRYAGDGSGRR